MNHSDNACCLSMLWLWNTKKKYTAPTLTQNDRTSTPMFSETCGQNENSTLESEHIWHEWYDHIDEEKQTKLCNV